MQATTNAASFLKQRVGEVPSTSVGWFRAGVGFYNKTQFALAVDALKRSVQLDKLNFNAYQILARALIALNRREEAIEALKESVKLDNPSDWQLLVELTGGAAATTAHDGGGDEKKA